MTMRVRAKICGITSPEDALLAASAGADAIGLVFYRPSPRYVTIQQAREICEVVPPFVTIVGLFVDHLRTEISEICENIPLGLLQFHGDESESDCQGYGIPYIKAVRVRGRDTVVNAAGQFPSAKGLLVDTYVTGTPGGTGKTFDWTLLPERCEKPLILAGGLSPENVREAVSSVRPYGVDVSGGVEKAKGVKDPDKVINFIREVARECQHETD